MVTGQIELVDFCDGEIFERCCGEGILVLTKVVRICAPLEVELPVVVHFETYLSLLAPLGQELSVETIWEC